MRRSLALLFVLPLLLLVLWLVLGRGTTEPAPQAPREPVVEKESAPAAEIEAASVPTDAGGAEAAGAERVQVPAPESTDPRPKLAELRGRFVLDGGAPAVGAKIAFGGWPGNTERVMKHGAPKDWPPLSAECDADGRFSLRFDPPRAFQFTLDASHPGCVTAKWRWSELEPASTTDLGETLLPRGGTITGRVLDAQGKSTRDRWQVYADAQAITKGAGSDASRAHTSADKETGQFRLEGLPPGRVELKAHSELANWINGPNVEVRAGETTEANIQYTGPDNSRRITVVTFARPFYIYDSDVNEIVLQAPGIEPRKAQKIANSSQSFSFDDLEPGTYSVTIDDPKFKPWRQDGVRPGQQVRAKLQGASAVSLAVLDAQTREPVARYALRARFDKSTWSPNEFEVFGAASDPPVGGLVEGLIPTEQTLTVLAQGYAPCELKLEELKPGEVRPLRAEVRRGTTLVARVLEADGSTPIPGLAVTIEPSLAGEERSQHVMRDSLREETSAADGSATFTAVAAGSYKLRVESTPTLAAVLDGVVVSDTDTRKVVELVFPPNGWLVGRVLGLEAAMLEGCYLAILPTDLSPLEQSMLSGRAHFDRKGPQNRIAADGSFRAGPLRAGKASVAFQFPPTKVQNGPNSSWTQPGAAIDLGEVEIPAGGELQREFDLRGRLPGFVEVTVRIQGAPAAHARVSILSADQQARGGTIDLDPNGHGTSAPLAAGPVEFILHSPDGAWSWEPEGTWTIPSGETLRVLWDVPLATGSLQILDAASGQPLAAHEVTVVLEGERSQSAPWVTRTTDSQGKVELRLVPAAYRLSVRLGDGTVDYEASRFDWTASGPVQAVLKLAKKP